MTVLVTGSAGYNGRVVSRGSMMWRDPSLRMIAMSPGSSNSHGIRAA
jgi:hypothetical protein